MSLFIVAGAVYVTLARLNHHHHPADDLAVPAPEADGRCLGSVRPAASPVRAGPAEPRLELLQATAACVGQSHWTAGLFCGVTLLAFLQSGEGHLVAWADFTDPSLFHSFALGVAVGDPGGHSAATGFGARRPSCGLRHAVDCSDQHVAHRVRPESG